jgi:hypothetical protein
MTKKRSIARRPPLARRHLTPNWLYASDHDLRQLLKGLVPVRLRAQARTLLRDIPYRIPTPQRKDGR